MNSTSPLLAVDTVVFDMDGTLLASHGFALEAIERAFDVLCAKYPDIPRPPREAILLRFGEPYRRFYTGLLPESHAHLFLRLHEEAGRGEKDALRNGRAALFPGVAETLRELKARGLKLALVSNCSEDYLEAVSAAFDFTLLFDARDCVGKDGTRDKTGVLRETLERLAARRALMVGDRVHDLEAARACGAHFAGCRYGYGKPEELLGGDLFLDSLSELLERIQPPLRS